MTPTRPRVLVTHWVHPDVINLLESACTVHANPGRDTWSRPQVLEAARDCEAMMAFMPDSVNEEFLKQCPKLKIVAAALKGADNFDIQACSRHGVWFTRVPDLLTVPTAELALGLMIGVARHMLAGDDHVRSGQFGGWRPLLYGLGLAGQTLGLIGMGAVGRAVAVRAAAFGMKVVYTDPDAEAEQTLPGSISDRVTLGALLACSDYVLPLTHLTPQTLHLLDARALAQMKHGAYLINVGRGSLVDEAAVARSLAAGHLAGYAADVFELEDWALEARPRTINPDLLANRAQTFFTPHLGSAVESVRRDIAMEAAENVLDVFAGRRPRGAVNNIA